ncbi:KIR protein [Plasmodium coatneyi]|uniref:KIR protein n=1 Tax=Plasmodium coatneyi TaxID=208452 RepID=A0A1B1DV81_9APIC|nr:KIR protein [Plasmodium coatneyi]ANQ06644.1 KIR protein [Plasmodium coatneyi]
MCKYKEGNLALSQLPSREKYSELKEKSENGGDTECKSGVKAKLGTHITNNGTTVNKIMGAFCHINEVEEKKRNSEEWCDYLYFWVGKMLSRNMEDTKFKTTMEKCRNDVFDGQKESKCEFPYTPTKKEVFAAYRRMFDYQKDKDFIRPELRGKGVTCPTKYSTYLRKVRYAYKVMSAECKQEGNSTFEWCKKFEGWYPQYKSRNKLDLKCKLEKMAKHKPEEELSPQVEPSSSSGSDPIETTNTKMTPAISGAAATIAGLGTVAFFLYKVTTQL